MTSWSENERVHYRSQRYAEEIKSSALADEILLELEIERLKKDLERSRQCTAAWIISSKAYQKLVYAYGEIIGKTNVNIKDDFVEQILIAVENNILATENSTVDPETVSLFHAAKEIKDQRSFDYNPNIFAVGDDFSIEKAKNLYENVLKKKIFDPELLEKTSLPKSENSLKAVELPKVKF